MNILLAVTGSISCYRSYDLLRSLVKEKHHVRVVLTQGALKFITPDLFRYLGAEEVYGPHDDFQPEKLDAQETVLHVSLSKWAHRLVIAPLSANTLEQLAYGPRTDLLQNIFLCFRKTTLLFPAMNTNMLHHPFIEQALEKLSSLSHVHLFPTQSGLLACGDEGEGKLLDLQTLHDCIVSYPDEKKMSSVHSQQQAHFIITAGATRSPLDPIRYLTNPSSGKSAYSLTKQALARGYRCTVIAANDSVKLFETLLPISSLTVIPAHTTQDMLHVVENLLQQDHPYDLYVSTAAIGDFEFHTHQQKLKKSALLKTASLELVASPDILSMVCSQKKPGQKIIGFAAETHLSVEILQEKWERKPVDLLIGNHVHNGLIDQKNPLGFGTDSGDYSFFEAYGITQRLYLKKEELAHEIIRWFEK
jgi:phosphopantothenoylcysteine decarboxylase/phosphopantothenate--cysteine ligase